jgi:hypothetical protein
MRKESLCTRSATFTRSNSNRPPPDRSGVSRWFPQYQARSASGQTKVFSPTNLMSLVWNVRHGRPGDGSFEIGKITNGLSQQEPDGQKSAAP